MDALIKMTIFIFMILIQNAEVNCENAFCGHPGRPAFGFYFPVKSHYNVNETVRFTCIKNYHLLGSANRTCTRGGDWDGNIPFCLKSRRINEFVTGNETWIKIFDRISDCDKDTCIGIKEMQSNVLQISLNKTVKFWEIVFNLQLLNKSNTGKENIIISVSNAGIMPKHVESIQSVYMNRSYEGIYSPARDVNVSFFPNHKEGKYINIKLQNYSSFMKICEFELFTVDRTPCGIPEVPLHGIVDKNKDNGIVSYSCDEAYYRNGTEKRKCLNGIWTDKPPRCLPKNLKRQDNLSESSPSESTMNVPTLLVIILISLCLFITIGIISVAYKVVIKKRDVSTYDDVNINYNSAARNVSVNIDEDGYMIPTTRQLAIYEEIIQT